MTWRKASEACIHCRMAGLQAPLTPLDQEKTAEVLARWDDDVSRAHHLQFLAWRRLREEWIFRCCSDIELHPVLSSGSGKRLARR